MIFRLSSVCLAWLIMLSMPGRAQNLRLATSIININIIIACQHIPTMTKSHHGGEMSVMIKVGMYHCQIPTIHDKLQLQQLPLHW